MSDCFGSCDDCGEACAGDAADTLLARAEKAEAEVVRLLVALEEIATLPMGSLVDVARQLAKRARPLVKP